MYTNKYKQVRYIINNSDTVNIDKVLIQTGLVDIRIKNLLGFFLGDMSQGVGYREAILQIADTSNYSEVITSADIAEAMVDSLDFSALAVSKGITIPQHQVSKVHSAIVSYLTELFDNIHSIFSSIIIDIKYLRVDHIGSIWLSVIHE